MYPRIFHGAVDCELRRWQNVYHVYPVSATCTVSTQHKRLPMPVWSVNVLLVAQAQHMPACPFALDHGHMKIPVPTRSQPI